MVDLAVYHVFAKGAYEFHNHIVKYHRKTKFRVLFLMLEPNVVHCQKMNTSLNSFYDITVWKYIYNIKQ